MNDRLLALKTTVLLKRFALKEGLQFCIQIEDDFEEIVFTALEEIFEGEGFVYAPDAQLCLKGRIKPLSPKTMWALLLPRDSLLG